MEVGNILMASQSRGRSAHMRRLVETALEFRRERAIVHNQYHRG